MSLYSLIMNFFRSTIQVEHIEMEVFAIHRSGPTSIITPLHIHSLSIDDRFYEDSDGENDDD
jgi:hypothetical protein